MRLFEYEPHDGQRDVPRNSDLGGHHVALYVDDMDAAADYLRAGRASGCSLAPWPAGNASAGQRWRYFLAPWGMQFELVSYPGGKAYEKDAAREAAPRAPPAR